MLAYFRNRRTRKTAKALLHHARHVRHMREDVAAPDVVERLQAAERQVAEALPAGNMDVLRSACEHLNECVQAIVPQLSFPAVRENLEIIVVAVAIAMAFRAYFLQPFKIPTGSMQPTLYGIHYAPQAQPGIMDVYPLKIINVALFGQGYTELRAKASGQALRDPRMPEASSTDVYYIGGVPHEISKDLLRHFAPGEYVVEGQLLASGVSISGDHIFVDKVRWNFIPPRRGNIMVFRTDGIDGIPPNTHYIKRMIGLPGEEIGIDPPFVLVNGRRVTEPATIVRIEDRNPGYAGYQLTHKSGTPLAERGDRLKLGKGQYLPMGDNTGNSLDGRYWGAVPQANLVGPACLVYWPLSSRWGLAR